ncbi:MAG: ABC-2 type transport system ATP-binding protein [Saprospiraceae bacterium]|jgi:ABC-2 type transport system ATP-binding protein
MPVLEIKNLSKSYGRTKALDNLNLTIEPGQIYGILGPNGSGKTTTLGILLDILKQDSGTFKWFDGKYGEHSRLKIGAILETPNFYPYMNGPENLNIIRQIKGIDSVDSDALLEQVNLAHRKKSAFRAYSLGMKQRLAIAATLIGDPEVVIFDEPTNGLDPEGISEVRNILANVAKGGRTVIMASHLLDEVEKICSHVAIIKNGKLLATGPVGSILSNDITIEVNASDRERLTIVLKNILKTDIVIERKQWIECQIDDATDIEAFSRQLYSEGIVPTHFVVRRRKLEEEFLAITQNS